MSSSPMPTAGKVQDSRSAETSKIVKVVTACGLIVLILAVLILFIKISAWLRYHQQVRRQRRINKRLREQNAQHMLEQAMGDVEPGALMGLLKQAGITTMQSTKGRKMKNAHAVAEWEGVAA